VKIEYVDHLLCVPLTIKYKEKKKNINRMIIDTGAAHSIISSDVADEIGIFLKMATPLSGHLELAVKNFRSAS
jgi:predicted aspartyl protease